MGLFTSRASKTQQQEAAQVAESANAQRKADAAARSRREDAWRKDRNAVLGRLHPAKRAHTQAKQAYDRYAPGPQKTAAGRELNIAADRLAKVEREFDAVNDFRAWDRNH